MRIRSLWQADIQPLHELYNCLAEGIPHQTRVGLEQFREDIRGMMTLERPGVFLPAGEIQLVAERNGRIVGVALGSYLQERGKYAPARTGMVRFMMTEEGEEEACQAMTQTIVEHLQRFVPDRIRAMPYWYGPRFYNMGCGRLTGAWPWVGHALMRAGFAVLAQYGTEVRMRRPIRRRAGPLPLPEGAEVRKVPAFSRAGPDFENWFDLFINGEKAGECHCLYGENFVRGTGRQSMYLEYLEVKEPYQGRGLGRVMLRHALDAAYNAGAAEASLTTDATNFAALNLYRSEGYAPVDLLFEFELLPQAGIVPVMAW